MNSTLKLTWKCRFYYDTFCFIILGHLTRFNRILQFISGSPWKIYSNLHIEELPKCNWAYLAMGKGFIWRSFYSNSRNSAAVYHVSCYMQCKLGYYLSLKDFFKDDDVLSKFWNAWIFINANSLISTLPCKDEFKQYWE